MKLEKEFGRSLLQLACRHHIFELVGGASCSNVYGQTTGPKEVFKKLIDNWNKLKLDDYLLIDATRNNREFARYTSEMITFLQNWTPDGSPYSLEKSVQNSSPVESNPSKTISIGKKNRHPHCEILM